MTAKEAATLIKNRTYVKWYDVIHDTFIYGKYIETLKIFFGRRQHDVSTKPQLITSARIRVSNSCVMTVDLKDLYLWAVSDDEIRKYYSDKIEHIGRSQRSGVYIRCPRCGGELDPDITKNGESKRDARALLCPLCVKVEQFCDENKIPDPFTDWWCFLTEDETI